MLLKVKFPNVSDQLVTENTPNAAFDPGAVSSMVNEKNARVPLTIPTLAMAAQKPGACDCG